MGVAAVSLVSVSGSEFALRSSATGEDDCSVVDLDMFYLEVW